MKVNIVFFRSGPPVKYALSPPISRDYEKISDTITYLLLLICI